MHAIREENRYKTTIDTSYNHKFPCYECLKAPTCSWVASCFTHIPAYFREIFRSTFTNYIKNIDARVILTTKYQRIYDYIEDETEITLTEMTFLCYGGIVKTVNLMSLADIYYDLDLFQGIFVFMDGKGEDVNLVEFFAEHTITYDNISEYSSANPSYPLPR